MNTRSAIFSFVALFAVTLPLADGALAQSMQGSWQYLLKTTDGINSGMIEIDARGNARASGKVTGIAYTQTGTASQSGGTVDIRFTEAKVANVALNYQPDHFVCRFKSANLMDCRLPDPGGLTTHDGYGPMARAGSPEAATLGQEPVAVEGKYYSDRRTSCRLWTVDFSESAVVQWSGACRNGLAEGAGVLTLKHSAADEAKFPEVRIEGSYSAGKLNGRSLITYAGGSRFEGDVKNGILHGHGRFTMPGKGYYDGDYRDGTWFGHGVLVYEQTCGCELAGGRYDGEFVNGTRQGTGVFTKANGDRYEGGWGKNLPEGPGTYTWNSGRSRYSGKWASDCSMDSSGRLHSFFRDASACEVMRDYFRMIR